jgi:type IV pilus assembly protein PilM
MDDAARRDGNAKSALPALTSLPANRRSQDRHDCRRQADAWRPRGESMLAFIQSLFAPMPSPIGIDFGTDCLRMAQVHFDGKEHRLVGAASKDVPPPIRRDAAGRSQFFIETVREMLGTGRFRGRAAVLALPAASVHIEHLRIAPMAEAEMTKALAWEARGRMPVDPANALMRHIVAGEVYQDSDLRNEVIVFAAAREFVHRLLADAEKARLDVIGMNVEPMALVDCFGHVWRRKSDATMANCFLDMGHSASRAVIARGNRVMFARTISLGGDQLTGAVAEAMGIGAEQARSLRIKLAEAQPSLDDNRRVRQLDGPGDEAADGAGRPIEQPARPGSDASRGHCRRTAADLDDEAGAVELACRSSVLRVAEELDLCRRYFEATFPGQTVGRLVFVGGEARHRGLCQQIARQLGIAAQVGDPMVRMSRISDLPADSGIDRRLPQPSWAVAIGLSLGPVTAAPATTAPASAAATTDAGAPTAAASEHAVEAVS